MIELSTESLMGGSVTKVRGSLDGQTYQQFSEEVKKQIASDGKAILDFQAVDSVNAEGLRALLALNHWIKAKNGQLVVAGLSGAALEAFKSSGCDRLLRSYTDVNAAKQGEGLSGSPSVQSPPPVPRTEMRSSATRAPSPPPMEESADEWSKTKIERPISIRTNPSTVASSPAKSAFPLLPLLGALVGIGAIAGLAYLFWPKGDETVDQTEPEPRKMAAIPEIRCEQSYSFKVGQAAQMKLSTTNVERLFASELAEGLAQPKAESKDAWIIAGTPIKAGKTKVTLTGISAHKESRDVSLEIDVAEASPVTTPTSNSPIWTTNALADGQIGQAYSIKLAAKDATSFEAQSLPEGLKLYGTEGEIGGVPLKAGSFPINLAAVNASGKTALQLTLLVKDADAPREIGPGDELENVKATLRERVRLAPREPEFKEQVKKQIDTMNRGILVGTIEFPLGSTEANGKRVNEIMSQEQVKAILEAEGWLWFSLGYADPTGGNKDANYQLSEKRAKSVADAMKGTSLKKTVTPVPMGETDQVDKARREGNRIVEIWAILP